MASPDQDALGTIDYCLVFEGPTRALLHALKYSGRTSVTGVVARAATPLAATLVGEGLDCLVPVPLHSARRRERGFNQSALLAEAIGERIGVPVVEGLRRVRPTRSQASLRESKRMANVRDAFGARPLLARRRILLLDDVVTTGATLAEAARAARRGGAAAVCAMAVAGRPRAGGSGESG
jgi:ComF family protein